MCWVITVTIFVVSAGAMKIVSVDDSDGYESSLGYKKYAAHYGVTTYDYSYPRVHADSISYSSKEHRKPVHGYSRSPRHHRHVRDVSIDTMDGYSTPSYFAEAPKDFLAPNYYETEAPIFITYSAPTFSTETSKYDANNSGFYDGEIPTHV
jgi:hypothetical protein